MRWHYLQHVSFEGPAHLADWARDKGHGLTCTRVWEEEGFPSPDAFDRLFVLGGPMNVYEETLHPWLVREKEFLCRAIEAGKPILGICLGAQLLSVVLGATVSRNEHREVGWLPVWLTPEGRASRLFSGFPDEFPALHWHGDRFSIPPGAAHAARSCGCEFQAFIYGDRVVGLQFHLESTEASIRSLLEHCPDDLARQGPYVQSADSLLGQGAHLEQDHALLAALLDRLAG
jgi:GMP synthase-like glutamine amidotransferase